MPHPTPVHLDNVIQPYVWGSTRAIAEIQGRTPGSQPEAELWIGVHPAGPSRVRADPDSSGPTLSDVLAQHGRTWLGDSRTRFGDTLPFLLKVLAAAQPLSLQVHPHKARAQEVFQRQPAGPYVDTNHKPELLCALTKFTALHGFRSIPELQDHLSSLTDPPPRIARAISLFLGAPTESGLRQLLSTLMSLAQSDVGALHDSIKRYRHSPNGQLSTTTATALDQLTSHYPHDALVIAPLLLNVVTLEPGEAIFTGPGVLHSYLEGVGVELMANSDNVVRAGLTSKPTDVTELLNVTRFEPQPSELSPLRPREGSGFSTFITPAQEFELSILRTDSLVFSQEPDPAEIQILLTTSGSFTVANENGRTWQMPSGESLLIPARTGPYSIEGTGTLFRASLPAAQQVG